MAIKLSLHSLGGAIKAKPPKFNRKIPYHLTLFMLAGILPTQGQFYTRLGGAL
jgi:hypothetical protein